MPKTVRPGDVLADRYRLVDLLTESGDGRFWRAHDAVLERQVALHVIAEDDARAPGLLEAARRSATVLDRHLLRVLDADQLDGICYVVNEWADGSSLDVLLAHDGPLAARRAAWLVAEVAACIAVAHEAGVAHGRLVPENVLIDRTGSVRVIGFAVDAALHGLPAGRLSTDVADLGGLLYCALTGTWPGVSRTPVPTAPHDNGRVLRPRQVRAGIPRPLDSLCDTLVNPYAGPTHQRAGHDLTTARGIADYLSEFVGDDTGMAEAEAGRHPVARGQETMVFSPLPEPGDRPEDDPEDDPADQPVDLTETQVVALPPVPVPDEAHEDAQEEAEDEPPTHRAPLAGEPEANGPTPVDADPASDPAADQLTQAGLPIFDDVTDDVSWLAARPTPPPPPPPFEEPPERPLFAPEPDQGQPARRPRPGSPATTGTGDYWPWDTGTGTGTGPPLQLSDEETEDGDVPGRSWLRLAAAIAAGLVLLVAIVVAYNLGRGRTPLGAEPRPKTPSSSAPPPRGSAEPALITDVTAADLDPQGDPPEENPELAPASVDGDPATAWRTMTYQQNFGPAGLKTGVGLTLDLGTSYDVSDVDLELVGIGTGVSVYVTGRAPDDVTGLEPAAEVTAQAKESIPLSEPATGRFVTVWLTSLPPLDGQFRGEVAEISVRGVPTP